MDGPQNTVPPPASRHLAVRSFLAHRHQLVYLEERKSRHSADRNRRETSRPSLSRLRLATGLKPKPTSCFCSQTLESPTPACAVLYAASGGHFNEGENCVTISRMGLIDFTRGELIEIFEFIDDSRDTISSRFPDS